MKYVTSLVQTTAVLLLSATAFTQQQTPAVDGRCGAEVQGIVLCLSYLTDASGFVVELRNVGNTDTVLNLGIMLANGARQYPTAIKLLLIDSHGNKYEEPFSELELSGIIAGRVDPFVVPLPSGASLKLPMKSKFSPGEQYTVQAQFIGKGVSFADANLDIKGISLMHYWIGSVISNVAVREFQPPPKVH